MEEYSEMKLYYPKILLKNVCVFFYLLNIIIK